jgi:hydroxypyruvate reductase
MSTVSGPTPFHLPLDDWIAASLTAANPTYLLQSRIQLDENGLVLGQYRHAPLTGRIFLISVGKAAVAMSQPLLTLLDDRLTGGVIISKAEPSPANLPHKVQFFQGGHPTPTEASVKAGAAVRRLLRDATADDLVICLISGGASALMTAPRISLDNWRALNNALLASGCAIHQFNAVRQQLDELKGGGLARLAAPAACVSLILSDVTGNPLALIGSGPTAPAAASPAEARAILTRYKIPQKLPPAVWQAVEAALPDKAAPPLPDSPRHYEIIGDVNTAAQALATAVTASGYELRLLTVHLEGEAREVGKLAAALAKGLSPGQALILGGETTVTLRGDGRGGRNQELALSAAIGLEGCSDRLILTLATDGEDGPTPAAGAWVTGETVSRAREMGVEAAIYLDNNDSYAFFAQVGGLLEFGPTGTNVNDLLLILRIMPR